MDLSIKTSGVILKRQAVREYNGRIIAYTKTHGKMQLMAMGLYRPSAKLSSTLISGNLVYLTLTKGTQWHITGAKTITPYSSNFVEPRLLYLSSIVREILLELFPDEEANVDIYDKAVECFTLLASSKHSLITKELILYRFVLAVFSSQGLLPNFSKCARERRVLQKDELRFWKRETGILCEVCAKKESGTLVHLPNSITAVESYTTADTLSSQERLSLTTMLQDIYGDEHKNRLKSLEVWNKSL
jgi:DNA repair protein RecO